MAVRKIEAELEKMSVLGDAPPAEALPALRKALSDRVNVIAAKAARIAGERRFVELVSDLLRAFDRLFEKPVERDPQCWGKNAIAKALVEMDYRESAPYLRGVRHIQMEPVWGGVDDTASTLRGTCVLALATCSDIAPERTLRCMVDALADEKAPVRLEAARALAQMDGGLILRLKARVGDEDPSVVGQVFDALLAVERDDALEFVAEFLGSKKDEVREEAALALGSSRMPGAVELLKGAWQREKDPVMLRALSASRQEEAIGFLLELVRDGRMKDASAALEALALNKESAEIREKARQAAETREPEIRSGFESYFRATNAHR